MASEPEADGEADFIQSRRIKGRLCRWGQRRLRYRPTRRDRKYVRPCTLT